MGGGGANTDGGADAMPPDAGSNDGGEITCRPLDLFVLVQATAAMDDESSVPGATWWEVITEQLESLFVMPKSAGMRVGLTFIGGPAMPVSCEPPDYESLDVPLGELPSHASALSSSLEEREVVGSTALSEAFQGIATVASESAASSLSHITAILFVTNATATACNTSDAVETTAQIAGAVYAQGIPTVVAGVGEELTALDQIASAGGTFEAFLFSDPNSANEIGDFFAEVRCRP